MAVLVTGGAGYIGSHTANQLLDKNEKVVILDDLSTGSLDILPKGAKFYKGDFGDSELVKKIIDDEGIDSVIHFAAFIVVPESVENPFKYYNNNFVKALDFIKACYENDINKFIFSSTAAVYGDANEPLINELVRTEPINAYGQSKLNVEGLLRDVTNIPSSKFKYVILRYFNVAGANVEGKSGQICKDATHLIKVASQAALGIRSKLQIYGSDYNTKDGTCVRDYIHVEDLANAHLLALNYLRAGGNSEIFNCGYGEGFSVKEVIDTMKKVSKTDFKVEMAGRRPGDSAQLVADSTKLRKNLNWEPRNNDLEYICKTALDWEKKVKNSYTQSN